MPRSNLVTGILSTSNTSVAVTAPVLAYTVRITRNVALGLLAYISGEPLIPMV